MVVRPQRLSVLGRIGPAFTDVPPARSHFAKRLGASESLSPKPLACKTGASQRARHAALRPGGVEAVFHHRPLALLGHSASSPTPAKSHWRQIHRRAAD